MPKRRRKRVFAQITHPFWFQITNGDGTVSKHRVNAKVRMATEPVDLIVTEDHVERAIAGSTSKCTMALCCYAHKADFPHEVEGHVDWQYSRCFVVSKLKNGLPGECVAYEHDNKIARMNDTPGGMQKLLALIKKNGPITVHLRPYRKRSKEGRPGRDRKGTGVRDPQRTGARLRFDVTHAAAPDDGVK